MFPSGDYAGVQLRIPTFGIVHHPPINLYMKINQFIDHTILSPIATLDQVSQLCREAEEHQFKAVCVAPLYVDAAVKLLSDSEVSVCTVIGFPFGYDHLATKMAATTRAIDEGADELDVVINLPQVKNGEWDIIETEIDSFVTSIKLKRNKVMKLILETAYLTVEELEILCNLCTKYRVDFAKTSTGYAPDGATVENVTRMRTFLGDHVQIKASGGIRSKDTALELINAGATRLGTSSGIKLLK